MVLRDQGVTESTVHACRGERSVRGLFSLWKTCIGSHWVWLYTLQSFCLRCHQNKVVLPWGRNPSGFDPGPAGGCAFTETKSIPKGGTSAAAFTAASPGQRHKGWSVLQGPHLTEHSSDQQWKPLCRTVLSHRGQYKHEIP